MITASPRLSELTLLEGTRQTSLLPGVEQGAFRLIMDEECFRLIGVRPDGRMVTAILDRFLPDLIFACN